MQEPGAALCDGEAACPAQACASEQERSKGGMLCWEAAGTQDFLLWNFAAGPHPAGLLEPTCSLPGATEELGWEDEQSTLMEARGPARGESWP